MQKQLVLPRMRLLKDGINLLILPPLGAQTTTPSRVSYRIYRTPTSDHTIFAAKPPKEVSFDVGHGRTTALVGRSGSGKKTLTYLLLRYWDVQTGKIMLCGEKFSFSPG
jgi:ABC-type glutathione transport system ATPase component